MSKSGVADLNDRADAADDYALNAALMESTDQPLGAKQWGVGIADDGPLQQAWSASS